MNFIPGSYVTHARLPELGSGEILSSHEGKMQIRFASGDRAFMYDLVVEHLTITTEAPAKPPPKAKRASKAKTAVSAAKAAAAAAKGELAAAAAK